MMPATMKLNVVVGMRVPKEQLDRIAAVDPRLEVMDASEGWRADFARRRRPLNEQEQQELARFERQLEEADVYFNLGAPDHLLARAPRLKWMHLAAAGIDSLQGTPLMESSLLLTYSRGFNARWVAETAMGHIFMLACGAKRLVEQQQRHEWRVFQKVSLYGKTLAVVGLGHIGTRVAEMAQACGMRIIGMRRGIAQRTAGSGVVETLYPRAELKEMLAEADFVLLAAPLTPETEGMIGEAEFAVMKPTAFLVNIARGQLTDEAALARALAEGRLAGAGIDVFTVEPLPQDSPFWDLPNVLVSPHYGGRSDETTAELVGLFVENLRRFLNGEELLNRVDRTRGY